jgi:hypothetical protein
MSVSREDKQILSRVHFCIAVRLIYRKVIGKRHAQEKRVTLLRKSAGDRW